MNPGIMAAVRLVLGPMLCGRYFGSRPRHDEPTSWRILAARIAALPKPRRNTFVSSRASAEMIPNPRSADEVIPARCTTLAKVAEALKVPMALFRACKGADEAVSLVGPAGRGDEPILELQTGLLAEVYSTPGTQMAFDSCALQPVKPRCATVRLDRSVRGFADDDAVTILYACCRSHSSHAPCRSPPEHYRQVQRRRSFNMPLNDVTSTVELTRPPFSHPATFIPVHVVPAERYRRDGVVIGHIPSMPWPFRGACRTGRRIGRRGFTLIVEATCRM